MPARRMLSVVVVVALVPAAGAAGHSLDADAQSGQAPTRESLAQVVKPPGAPGRTLGLARVTIPPRHGARPAPPSRRPDRLHRARHPDLHRPDGRCADLSGRRRRLAAARRHRPRRGDGARARGRVGRRAPGRRALRRQPRAAPGRHPARDAVHHREPGVDPGDVMRVPQYVIQNACASPKSRKVDARRGIRDGSVGAENVHRRQPGACREAHTSTRARSRLVACGGSAP